MAKASTGVIDRAMASKPVVKTKRVIGKAVDAAVDAFQDPPLAPDSVTPRKRTATKKAAKKSSANRGAIADRRLVSTMEDYEVKYLAQKHSVTQKAVKAAVAKVGHSRNKVEAELRRSKA